MDLEKLHLTLTEALSIASPKEVIYLEDKVYVEKVTISTPQLTLVGRDHTVISFDASHGTIIPQEFGGDGQKVYGTTGSATFLIKPEARGFHAVNITFQNTYMRRNCPNGQAVAFKSECSDMVIKNCRFLGHQDTLYIDEGKNNVIRDSYIEGDVDFVFGSADCLFDHCVLKALQNDKKLAYFLAPNTFTCNEYGFVFDHCQFMVEKEMEVYLGRAWYPSKAKKPVYPRVHLIHCDLDSQIMLQLIQMHPQDPREYNLTIDGKDCLS